MFDFSLMIKNLLRHVWVFDWLGHGRIFQFGNLAGNTLAFKLFFANCPLPSSSVLYLL